MGSTAHTDPEMMKEWEEKHAKLLQKAKTVAEWIKQSSHFICFTGAGISTAAGIPDFRGPQGVWTLQAKGIAAKKPKTSMLTAIPTMTHMSLLALQEAGLCKYVVSQNVDGLHRKSGINPRKLSELHGNTNLETCSKCGKQYMRDFRTRTALNVHDHKTGRICEVPNCKGELEDSIINFGENLPERDLNLAFEHANKADLCLALGSSLSVTPAADVPDQVASNGGRLVIVNLQKTPLDSQASLRVFAKCDVFMAMVMDFLEMDIPQFRLRRTLKITTRTTDKPQAVQMKISGIDLADNTPMSFLKEVYCDPDPKPDSKNYPLMVKREPFKFSLPLSQADIKRGGTTVNTRIRLHFMGHYDEPPMKMDYMIQLPINGKPITELFQLVYNPFNNKWKYEKIQASLASESTISNQN